MAPIIFFKCPVCSRMYQPDEKELSALEATCRGCQQLLTSNPYSTIRRKIPEGSEIVTLNMLGRTHFQYPSIEPRQEEKRDKSLISRVWSFISKGDKGDE